MPEAPVKASAMVRRLIARLRRQPKVAPQRDAPCAPLPQRRMRKYSRGQFSMPDQHSAAGAEVRRQILGEVDRTVPAAGATDRYCQITAIVVHEARQPFFDVVADVR